MTERQELDYLQQYVFTQIQLFKTQTLGTGSYGVVCKARCDQLLCAAKLLYPVLFQTKSPDLGKEHTSPFRRFQMEYQFLSRINHPNIVQYLGTYYDPDTSMPVLLMELMDESLTHFLESSPGDLPYHTQVNLSYDIAQALAFLHSNGIIHRNLSSNNVLLLASSKAKVNDFGMFKFSDLNAIRLATMTLSPGIPAYMSPEALNKPPVYTENVDNFSFGVLLVQIITRQFPKPTDRLKMRELVDPDIPGKIIQAMVSVPELERRQAHIDLIPPDHPLLPNALHCLKDNDSERPTAAQLCQTLTALKRTARYQESSQQDLHQLLREKDTQLLAKNEEILKNQEVIQQQSMQLQVKDDTIEKNSEQILLKHEELDQATQVIHTLRREIECREDRLRTLHHALQLSEKNCTALQQTIQQRDREVSELRKELASKTEQNLTTQLHQMALQHESENPSTKPLTVGSWQSLPNARNCLWWGSSAIIEDKLYFKSYDSNAVHELSKEQWNELPNCPYRRCTIISIDDTLTTVGGSISSKLYSYINSQWVENFPSMPTKRRNPAAVYTNHTLVVAGGDNDGSLATTIEVLNIVNRQWSKVSSLPLGMSHPSATICGSNLYIHPRNEYQENNSVYKCSLVQLVQSQPSSTIWETISCLPVIYSSLVTIDGQLLAVGGEEAYNYTNNIYQHTNTSWTVVGHMTSPRSMPTTAILPDNKLILVGGEGAFGKCEVATITY